MQSKRGRYWSTDSLPFHSDHPVSKVSVIKPSLQSHVKPALTQEIYAKLHANSNYKQTTLDAWDRVSYCASSSQPLAHVAKEEVGGFPEAHNTGIASTGALRALPAAAAWGQGQGHGQGALAPHNGPMPAAEWHLACVTASRFQTPPDSAFECFQPAFLTSNL